ncbi:MAG: hypothetical protein KDE52_13640 [Calditrichaeota bacterium]|nr:hypothetical protein [Calditrichota bacterium]MCB0266723.1 hypothetical protein [Calditrichota bacterium]MCB0288349.1 hypothetical protein [Calditrichota bacterium]MCB0301093.1 hypothetical protein [Calditrichota bacterium]MCB9068392.1 hypothetical protein [Calditrichia bacterium]
MKIDNHQLKTVLKEALVEVLEERQDLLVKLVEDALDNVALVSAIQSGEETPLIKRAAIAEFFKGNL